jgi:G3E family GTPase
VTTDTQPSAIPVTLIGGFLGAGKTTLLNHVLSENHGLRAAVLVNDFGAINIDAKLVVGVEGDTVELANGCVCCTIRDDLAGACLGLLQRPEPPEHLFIELSGVSDPVPVLNTFLDTELKAAFSFNSILAVVDAEQFPLMKGDMAQLARTQLGAADIVVLNKVDLVTKDDLDRVKEILGQVAHGSKIVEAVRGSIPIELVHAGHDAGLAASRQSDGHHHHSHGHGLSTWSWTDERPLSLHKLRTAIEALPDSVYRCKGIIHLEEMPRYRYVLQMVGKRYQIDETELWGEQLPRNEIVLIGGQDGMDDTNLKQAFDTCVGTGDDNDSPVLRLVRKLAPDLLTDDSDSRSQDHAHSP